MNIMVTYAVCFHFISMSPRDLFIFLAKDTNTVEGNINRRSSLRIESSTDLELPLE
jgi:hypothetical protein